MGTVMNGNKWSGVCVGGNVVSGLAKNGVVFYKKAQSIYKRRIMIGDNLKGQTIYFDFPDDYYLIRGDDSDSGIRFFIFCDNNYYLLQEMWDNDGKVIISEAGYYYSTGHIYDFNDNINLSQVNNSPLIPADSLDVYAIYDCQSYRHCYIEDPNIRPIQIGDNLSGATLYFVIPDNVDWFNVVEETEMYECISTDSVGYFAVFPQDGSGDGTIIYNSIDSGEVFVRFNGEIEYNISKLTLDNDFGTIISIDGGNSCPNLSQYILVDTTTLGT